MRSRIVVPAILLGLVALAAIWAFSAFERVPAKERVPASGEARLNPFLAAERFAARMGLEVAQLRSLPALDQLAPEGVLLLPARREGFDAQRVQRILAWVGAGGHLIVEAEPPGVADPVLDALAVKRASGERLAKPLALELEGRKLAVTFYDALVLEAPARAAPKLAAGNRLFSIARARGTVTVASSLHFARNGLIGAHDNATFLWALLSLSPARELQVFFQPERLSLAGFLATHAWPALAAGGLLLLAWLWRIAPRFGPVAPDLPPARRRLLDHLRASGRYYWSQNLRARLAVAARDAALRRLAQAQPDFAPAPQAEKAARLASLLQAPREEAARFLAGGGALRGGDFIRLVQHAQRIHNALEKGDK